MQSNMFRTATIRSIDYRPEQDIAPPSEPHLKQIADSLRRHWAVIATTTAAALLVAGLYLALATPQYTATGLILIDTKTNTSMRSTAPQPTDANVESATIESLVEILNSEQTMRRIVEGDHLSDDPALNPGPVTQMLATAVSAITFWKSRKGRPSDPIINAARALRKLVSAKRVGLTYAVEVSATLPDPSQAASVANTFAQVFIDDQISLREALTRRISGLLEKRAQELRAQAQDAERAVEQLKFSGSLEGENSATARVKLKDLESAAQTYRLLHDKFLERYAETWQQQFLSLPDAQIVSAAYPPQSKSAPRTWIVLASAFVLGAALGLIRVILRDRRVLGLHA